jgi:hypothetical protein
MAVSGPSGFYPQQHWLGQNQGNNFTFNLQNLPAGNYLVTTIPNYNGAAISMQAALVNGVTGSMTTDGTATSVQTYVPGQNAYLTFNGTADQNLTLALSQLALTPTSVNSASVSVTNPDGSFYTSGTCYTSSTPGCSMNLGSLDQTGTYTVTVNPDGQAMLTFTATANEVLIFSVSSITTTPANTAVIFYLYNSDGGYVTQASMTTDGTLNLGNLAAGTYTIDVVPNNAASASMSVDLQPGATAVPTDGSSNTITTNSPGQNAYVTFSGTAGQSISVSLTNLVLSPSSSSSANWSISAPDESSVMGTTGCSAGPPGCTGGLSRFR